MACREREQRHRRRVRAVARVVGFGLLMSQGAWAGPRDVWVAPAQLVPLSPMANREAERSELDAGTTLADPAQAALQALSEQLATLWPEALRDYGLEPIEAPAPAVLGERAWLDAARHAWVFVPTVLREPDSAAEGGSSFALQLLVVPFGSDTWHQSRAVVPTERREVTALGQLRRLITPLMPDASEAAEGERAQRSSSGTAPALRSAGRGVLAVHAAGLGGLVGFTLQRAAGSTDPRLNYPMAAIGAGIGLGASVVVSQEWDISVARAWTLSAAAIWPAVGVWSLAEGLSWGEPGQRSKFGVLGAVGGASLAVAGLYLHPVNTQGALLAHSAGGLGALTGALTEMLVLGDTRVQPSLGIGLGALAGALVGGSLGHLRELPPSSDLVFVDLGVALGGLSGAALATPVLFSEPGRASDRWLLGAVMAGMGLGGALGWWLPQRGRSVPALEVSTGIVPLEGGLGLSTLGRW